MKRLLLILLSCSVLFVACGKEKAKDESPKTDSPKSDDALEAKPISLGVETTIDGEVKKDENGEFSLERAFLFTLETESKLRINKGFSSASFGVANVHFFVFDAGDEEASEPVGSVSFFRETNYEGNPHEIFDASFPAGTYIMYAQYLLEQEAFSTYWDFTLVEAE